MRWGKSAIIASHYVRYDRLSPGLARCRIFAKNSQHPHIGAAVCKINTAENIWIVPGIQSVSGDGLADVMRGEETALAGILAQYQISNGLFCLPGTHSKWVTVRRRKSPACPAL